MSPIPYKTPPTIPPKEGSKLSPDPVRRKSKRPRKRLTQTLAEKGTEPTVLYRWVEVLDSFVFNPDAKVNLIIMEQDGRWLSTAVIMGKRYVGWRDNLEQAFKATANLLYQHAKEYWLRMDSRPITAKFHDFLKGEV